jgi:XTP/dITP diphosphohydrolase
VTSGRILLVATTNAHKLEEIRGILAELPIILEKLDPASSGPPPEETGRTFAENARLKALHYSTATGLLTVAEDSGLEIEALDGAPGVFSARYGEPAAASYPQKFDLIYHALRERGVADSRAWFTCAVAMADGGRFVFETTGRVEGRIAPAPQGTGGFGYDPIFFYPRYGRTLAEVSPEEKARVSHRGVAFRRLKAFLMTTM